MPSSSIELRGTERDASTLRGQGPDIKAMTIKAAHQFQQFTWDTANNNDVEHGIYAQMTWSFIARSSLVTLSFVSDDPRGTGRGVVVAAISVTPS